LRLVDAGGTAGWKVKIVVQNALLAADGTLAAPLGEATATDNIIAANATTAPNAAIGLLIREFIYGSFIEKHRPGSVQPLLGGLSAT
jgi:hypothetical protein